MTFICGSQPSITFGKKNMRLFSLPVGGKKKRRKQTCSIYTKPVYHKQEHIGMREKRENPVKWNI